MLLLGTNAAGCSEAGQRGQSTAGAEGTERSLNVGEEVWYHQYLKREKWSPGTFTSTLGETNFKVLDKDGKQIHRHVEIEEVSVEVTKFTNTSTGAG